MSRSTCWQDPEIFENLKYYANWPTFPQLYINGELIGGADIMKEMYEKGELQKLLDCVKRPDRWISSSFRAAFRWPEKFASPAPRMPRCRFCARHLLTERRPLQIGNVPHLHDVTTMLELLKQMGVEVSVNDTHGRGTGRPQHATTWWHPTSW